MITDNNVSGEFLLSTATGTETASTLDYDITVSYSVTPPETTAGPPTLGPDGPPLEEM